MPRSNIQAGCFSGLSLRNLLHRRCQSVSSSKEPFRTPAESKDIPRSVVGGVDLELKHHSNHHGACFGAQEDWILEPDTPPSYSASSFYEVEDVKDAGLSADIIQTIEKKVDELNPELRELSQEMLGHPELAFEEYFAHDILVNFMAKHGFQVTRNYAGLETAWRAEYSVGTGGRVLGVNSEMDALPGIGHACGHNLIAISGCGIAVAIKAALVAHCIPGKVIILGTPPEESVGGKIILLEKGAYKEMDVCLMSHPSAGAIGSVSNGTTTSSQTMYVDFTGKAAHAAAAPWEGKNALDAAVISYSAISALRQQLKPDVRVHGIIEGKNWRANTIPDNSRLTYIVRSPSKVEMMEVASRVTGCFEAAASATGCTVKIAMMSPYFDLVQNSVLGREFAKNARCRYDMTTHMAGSGASTDFGNVSYEIPSLHPLYAIPTEPNGGNHTPAFARSAATQEAHDATMKVTKGLALTGFRVLHDAAFFTEVKTAFENDMKAHAGNRRHHNECLIAA
ncbi:Peptidase M20 domain-containing protein 2 [Hypsizygus marmoreus]|uniref:Peptidase M20 domain-containing protein 2 n=1 Tax=Hypsizygus marmoreus TaxID=39966 RepID=A0A369J1A6_HYPMA|nr:Peptidase M20 domain-containing protein 2 [Hypsizygus marmoreus]